MGYFQDPPLKKPVGGLFARPNHSIRADDGNLLMRFLDKAAPRVHDAIRGGQGALQRTLDARPNSPFSQMAELVGLNDPMSLVEGPAQAAGLLATAGKKGFKAFHGSPHDFPKFSMGKIGTGEGMQAYSHGLYFADAEDVAKQYKNAGNRRSRPITIDGEPARHWVRGTRDADRSDIEKMAADALDRTGGIDDALAHLKQDLDPYVSPERGLSEAARKRASDSAEAMEWIKTNQHRLEEPGGHMYEVGINARPDDFLDYDVPLSKQSEKVRSAVSSLLTDVRAAEHYGYSVPEWRALPAERRATLSQRVPESDSIDRTGQGLYDTLSEQAYGSPAAASAALREAGIPGMKFLDGFSRSAGEGSRNYVVYDDSLVEILKKYGLAGLLAGGMVAAQPKKKGT